MKREQRKGLGWAIGAVAAAILVAAIIVTTMFAARKPLGPGVVVKTEPNAKTGPTFSVLKMSDVNTGWAVAEQTIASEVLLRTEHGPTTWQDVTPTVVRRQGGLLQVGVIPNVGWREDLAIDTNRGRWRVGEFLFRGPAPWVGPGHARE